MMKRTLLTVMTAVVCAGCFDFTDPDFPEADAPAVLQVTVFADDAGNANIDGLLAPGLRIGGEVRTVSNDTLTVSSFKLPPAEVRTNGSRSYHLNLKQPQPVAELQLLPPRIEEVGTPPPVDWPAIARADPDTVAWTRGTDLVLHVHNTTGATPAPQIRQWFLDLTGSDRQFRVSSDGFPPETLRIPSEWIPNAQAGTIAVNLSFYQSGRQQSPAGDYIETISYTFQLRWFVRVKGP